MFNSICDIENLILAHKKALKGNRYKEAGCSFTFNFERNLLNLYQVLRQGWYIPKHYNYFVIHEPKLRHIVAPSFSDRVVQHALVDAIEPLFEKSFIYDSYACRKNKGSHFGAARIKKFLK